MFQGNRSDKGAHTHTLGSCCRGNLPVLRFGVVRGSSFPYRSCQSTAPKDFLFPHQRILTRLPGLVCLQEEDFPIEMRQDLVQGVHGCCTTSVVAANRQRLGFIEIGISRTISPRWNKAEWRLGPTSRSGSGVSLRRVSNGC